MRQIPLRRIGEYLQAAFRIIIANGGSYSSRNIIAEVEKQLKFSEYELARFEKTGYIRWQSIMHFYSVDCTKAGWLKKNNGLWYVTEEGAKALKLDPETFIKTAVEQFRQWKEKRDTKEYSLKEDEQEEDVQEDRTTSYEQAQESSRIEVEEYIQNLNPYEFQDLIAALMRGMGYYTPFIAPQGPDGGVDIIAYKDPFGAEGTRIKVQVKHRKDNKVTRQEVSALNGILRAGDVGLIVSSGGFSSDSIKEMRSTNNHIEKMDLSDFIHLWETYYAKLTDEDKNLLPLRTISFLAPEQ